MLYFIELIDKFLYKMIGVSCLTVGIKRYTNIIKRKINEIVLLLVIRF